MIVLNKVKFLVMRTIQTQVRLVEWLSAEDMHTASKKWLSELQFIKDEQLFFENLIKSYTLQFLTDNHFVEIKKIINEISKMQNNNTSLIKAIKRHENELEILVDGIDQIEDEVSYKNKHREFIQLMNTYFKAYQLMKKQLFEIVKSVMKCEKQKRLLE